jgi:probable HAF family extracellular repeat protein
VSSIARAINEAGQTVGESNVGGAHATEWSGGSVINLGGLPGSTNNDPTGINDAGQVVGQADIDGFLSAVEWSGGSVINLGSLPGFISAANGINDAGQVVGVSFLMVPEPSTWAMMLLGFAGLCYAGYRRSERVLGQNARL